MHIKPFKLLNISALMQQRYILPVALLFYIHNGLSVTDFILFQSIFYMVSLIAEIPAGYIGDIFPKRNVLIFSYLLYIMRIILWLFVGGYWAILSGEIFFALSKSFCRGISDSYIYEYLKANNLDYTMLKNYGNYNFYLSIASGIGGLAGAFLYKQYENFRLLLIIELVLNITAITIIYLLPNIKSAYPKTVKTFSSHIKTLYSAMKTTINDSNINIFMLYSAILAGCTNLFAWSFQPTMKFAGVPIILFGYLYLINHILRGGGCLCAQKIINIISYKTLGTIVGITHFTSFVLLFLNQKFPNSLFCFTSLIFICISIGIQMAYMISTTARIHNFILSDTRATSASVSTMLIALCSSGFLLFFKKIMDIMNVENAYFVFLLLYTFVFIILIKVNKRLNL